jgi:8-oxo-dGTP diphosphatase
MSEKTRYVLGFQFDNRGESVVLIVKSKPDWQRGLLNGVGGKIEAGESPAEAMAREFREETGVHSTPEHWGHFCTMSGEFFEVLCFKSFADNRYNDAKTIEGEIIEKKFIRNLEASAPHRMISNLPWLISMALDNNYNRPFMAHVHY